MNDREENDNDKEFFSAQDLLHIDSSESPSGKSRSTQITQEYCFSNLRFLKKLGSGGSCHVVLLQDITNDSYMVDKITTKKFLEVLQKELFFMTKLQGNKHFLAPRGFFQETSPSDDNRCHLLMDYFEGTDLESFISNHIITFCDMQKILTQVGQAILFMHFQGIVHRDVKPRNILINDSLDCKLIDFGVSWLGPIARGCLGTDMFMAPEVAAAKTWWKTSAYDRSIDYYSLGLTILYIGTNLCPLDFIIKISGKDGKKFLPLAKAAQVELNPHGNDELFLDLICGLLKTDPSRRLDDHRFLDHPFFKRSYENKRPQLDAAQVLQAVGEFQAKKYKKRLDTSKTQKHFEKKIKKHKNAVQIATLGFASVITCITKKFYNSSELMNIRPAKEKAMSVWWSGKWREGLKKRAMTAASNGAVP